MKEGTSIAIVRDYNTSPFKSQNTRLVMAWIGCGGIYAAKSAFLDTVENLPDGKERTCTWLIDAAHQVKFNVDGRSESIVFEEFRKRFESIEWGEANPDHPIAFLGAQNYHTQSFIEAGLKPMMKFRKGKRIAIVPSGSDAASTATREEILAIF